MDNPAKTPSNPPIEIRLGTRASALARWQADWVAERLRRTGCDIEIVLISTGGDKNTSPIQTIAGQGHFTKEIQRALLDHRIDLAVHSLKDLPTEPVDGLAIAAVPERESVQDALVSHVADSLKGLPSGARVGTGSRRRQSQLLHARPDLEVADIRGNVDTRLKKLDDGFYDAIVLASAGLRRLELADRITEVLPTSLMLPAVGQGALGIEIRCDDEATSTALMPLNDELTHRCVTAERAMLARLRGGCLAPVGAWCRLKDDLLLLEGVVLSCDGARRIAAAERAPLADSETLGQTVAERLLAEGAGELIEQARK